MPLVLVVEDGNGLPTANVYTDRAFVDEYHDQRGHTAWSSFDDAKKDACILRATDYVEKRFSPKYRGRRLTRAQGLQWPRADASDDSGFLYSADFAIPRCLKQAIAEYALRAGLVGELAPDPVPTVPRQNLGVASPTLPENASPIGPVGRVSNVVDKIEETISYKVPDAGKDDGLVDYPAADMLLKEVLRSTQNRRLARG